MAKHYSDQVSEDMDVYDAHDEKIGNVAEVLDTTATATSRSGGGYMRVPTGFLGMGKEHHIPFSAIRSVKGDRVYLDVSKDQLDNVGYNEGPVVMDDRADYVSGEPRTITGTTVSAASTEASAVRTPEQEDSRRLQLREEELVARKRKVQSGEVRLETQVVSEQRTLEVPVTREEVTIERHAVDRRPSDRPIDERGEVIEVPVHEEQVSLEKQAVVYEEVELGKREVHETEQHSGTVRREEVRVDQKGDVDLDQTGTERLRSDRNTPDRP